jgi:regulator of replication initiation timing
MLATIGTAPIMHLAQQRRSIIEQIDKLKDDIGELKQTYSTALLEKIADQKREESILPIEAGKIKTTVDEMEAKLSTLGQRQAEVHSALASHPNVLAYIAYLNTLPIDSEFAKEAEHDERLLFWYPVKVIGAQVGFMLPLLLLTIFWNAHAIKKNHETSILISAHLILICAIPIVLRLLYFVGDLLPSHLLYRILEQLQEWRLSFLWYYFAIFASVAVGLLLIYLAQRKLFTAHASVLCACARYSVCPAVKNCRRANKHVARCVAPGRPRHAKVAVSHAGCWRSTATTAGQLPQFR